MRFYYSFLLFTFLLLCALKAMSTEVVIMDYETLDYSEINVYDFEEREERDPCESRRYPWEY